MPHYWPPTASAGIIWQNPRVELDEAAVSGNRAGKAWLVSGSLKPGSGCAVPVSQTAKSLSPDKAAKLIAGGRMVASIIFSCFIWLSILH